MKITIVGAGKVGRGLARALRGSGHQVSVLPLRRGLPRRATPPSLLVLAVRDAALPALARQLSGSPLVSRRTAVVHVAGALGPEVLAPLAAHAAGIGKAHPMLSFASARALPSVAGAHVLLAGDAVAVRRAGVMARAAGMAPRHWPDVEPGLYHAAGGLLAGGAVALAAGAARLLALAGATGEPHRVLAPLLRSVAENLENLGLPQALTGPARRGDGPTIERHLAVLERAAPQLVPLYTAVVQAQLPLARELGEAPAPRLREIDSRLRAPRPSPSGKIRSGRTAPRATKQRKKS